MNDTPESKVKARGKGTHPNSLAALAVTQFKKGQSGNPKGRAPGFSARVRAATNDCEEIVTFLTAAMRGEIPGAKARDRLDAASRLLAYAQGTPVATQVNVDATAHVSDEIKDVALGEIETILGNLKATGS